MSYYREMEYTGARSGWKRDDKEANVSVSLVPAPLALPKAESPPVKKPAELEDIYIAVMGVTGAGKSRFISACTGQDVQIGHTLESCTTEVDDYTFTWKDKTIHLVDTPGFDDTHKSDREVLEGIATWMSTAYSQDIKLTGVLYLHRITDIRVGGTSLRNLTMFKKLCGDEFYPRVFLVTTMWDRVGKPEGEAREKELISKSDFWGAMIDGGACVERHYGTRDSAMDILGGVIRNADTETTKVLKVQHQMVDDGLRLDQTDAGRQFEAELLKQREKHEREIREMQEDVKMLLEMNQSRAAEQTEKQRKLFEERIAQSFDDQAKLRSTLEQIQQRQAEDLARMQEQVARDRAAYEEKIRHLQQAQSDLNRMDPNSQTARNLGSQIAQDQKDAAEMARNLNAEDKTFQKKVKRVFIKSKDWVKKNPNLVRIVAQNGLSLLLKIAEWEILTEITGVDVGPFARLVNGWMSSGGGGGGGGDFGGGDGGDGGDAGGDDGGVDNTYPDDLPSATDLPVTDPSITDPGSYIPPLNFSPTDPTSTPFDPSSFTSPTDTYPTDAPPAYPYSPSVYSVSADPYAQSTYTALAGQVAQQSIDMSNLQTSDEVQQVQDQLPISGIAAGSYDGYSVDDTTSEMNQMNAASAGWSTLQSAASMPIQ